MIQGRQTLYCPALRMKAGELAGIRDLRAQIAAHVIPRFIVPPPAERNIDQGELFVSDHQPDVSGPLSKHWYGNPVFIDVAYLINECGRGAMTKWLPKMFGFAREAGILAIPFFRLGSNEPSDFQAFRLSLSVEDELKMGICVDDSELVDPNLHTAIARTLNNTGLRPEDCAIFADLREADFSLPKISALAVRGNLDRLQELGRWQYIVFQGTNYPSKNSVAPDSFELWPRNEWIAWQEAVNFGRSTPEHLIFGDYAADCSQMSFSKSRASAIRHMRYTTKRDWLIQRGSDVGTDRLRMRSVCKEIVESGHFAGSNFSSADEYIFKTANGKDGPGNPTTWRQVNTTHHVTRVVFDLAEARGLEIALPSFSHFAPDETLFD